MSKIAAFGDSESIKGFAALGFDLFCCDDATKAHALFKKAASGSYGIVYITDEYAVILEKEIARFDTELLPAIIPIPGVSNNSGIGIDRLKKSVEQAVGSDIIFNKE